MGSVDPRNTYGCISMATGVGGGVVVAGEVYRGSSSNSGEIGHISIDVNGEECPCGNVGCLETTPTRRPWSGRCVRRRHDRFAGPSFAVAGSIYQAVIPQEVNRRTFARRAHPVRVVPSVNGSDAAATGGAVLVLQSELIHGRS